MKTFKFVALSLVLIFLLILTISLRLEHRELSIIEFTVKYWNLWVIIIISGIVLNSIKHSNDD